MPRDTSGPAFPVSPDCLSNDGGMSLRDYFAGQAMVGLSTLFNSNPDVAEGVRRAYMIADVMLKHRTID